MLKLFDQFAVVVLCIFIAADAYAESALADMPSLATGEVLFSVPDLYSANGSPGNVTADDRRSATTSFARAHKFCDEGDVGAALRWTARTLMFAPNHADARRVLGYERYNDTWAGAFALRQLEAGKIWNHEFGWVEADDLSRYEAGDRPLGQKWISAEADALRHAKIDDGWRIRTDHFQVTTNDSPESAVALATRLEETYQVWLQLCGGFFIDAADLKKRFEGKSSRSYRSKPFQVVYYRTRGEYNDTLLRQQPRIGMTLGIYFDTSRATHFFAGEDQDPGTITHEAVHQFFQESAPAARNVGGLSNAWIVEGIACYFESLSPVRLAEGKHAYTIGTPQAGRLPAAYQRAIIDEYYVPLAELCKLGTTDLQRRTDIAQLYSQSAGLATFFMHYQDGIYREPLLKYLQLVYAGRDKPTTLQEVTGQSFAELDKQYHEYLMSLSGEDRKE
ncbi:DUF1570 domain-containing protein [Bythopirellula polymerisocia]|uniref:DUF1570 domain-containing protein n=1 Tax=Bythopirellula polymerisocia TaxID=2528003 RepID=A0A5C6CZZ6_9BACT|nr:DUF1570 domain-containing protein [Bythopirellula polymerisocia]TWU30443.1 hypothetical protein Pla144_12300 [Bythopirellula polymerisocia]